MLDIDFQILGIDAPATSAAPLLVMTVEARMSEPVEVQALTLRCQVMIETARRPYAPADKARLRDLFGEPAMWDRSLRPLLLAHTGAFVPGFTGAVRFEVAFNCTYDMDVASSRFMGALEDGEAPIDCLFSGTMYLRSSDGHTALHPIGQHKDARFRLPMTTWRRAMDLHFPNSGWLRVRRDLLERLMEVRSRCVVPTWDLAMASLLASHEESVT